MKPTWISSFLLAFVLSVSCSTIKTSKQLAATNLSVGTLSVASATRSGSDDKTATIQAYRTSFVETYTRQPSRTPEPTRTPRPPTPTCEPLPDWLTPGASLLALPNKTVTDTLAALMLQTYQNNYSADHQLPAIGVTDDPFQIEIVDESIDPDWNTYQMSANADETRTVFYSRAPGPEPSGEDFDEWFNWWTAEKWFIEDDETGKTYRMKWEDHMPWRPRGVDGWVSKDVFLFSQFGNPWHGFLVGIDVRARKVILALQLEYWC